MKKKSSVITPPPEMSGEQGNAALATQISEEDRKEALLKLIRKGAPSVPPKEGEGRGANERMQFPFRVQAALFERIKRAAAARDLQTPVNTWIPRPLYRS